MAYNNYKVKVKAKKIITHFILMTISLTMLVPFFWMISSSLKTENDMFSVPPTIIPKKIAFENYVYMFNGAPWFKYFINTAIVTVFTIIGVLIVSSMAGYAFAKLRFKGKNLIFLLYIGTMMIPYHVLLLPQTKIIAWLGLIDTHAALIIPSMFSVFGTFMLRQFFSAIPTSLEDAAKIDGCGYPRIYWEIIIKNSVPALVTLTIFTFMAAWNDFLRPLIFLHSQELYTLTLGLAKFKGNYTTPWNQMMAGAFITMIPILLLFFFLQKYFIQSVVTSGMKG